MLGTAGACGVALMPCPPFSWLEITGGATDADMVVIPPTVCGFWGGAIIGSGCAVALVVLIGMDWALWKSPIDCIRFGI